MTIDMGKRVLRHCQKLLEAFNDGDSQACANLYDTVAMLRSPERQFIIGTSDIEVFWANVMCEMNGPAKIERVSIVFHADDYFIAESQWEFKSGTKLDIKETWCETNDRFEIVEQRISYLKPQITKNTSSSTKRSALERRQPSSMKSTLESSSSFTFV